MLNANAAGLSGIPLCQQTVAQMLTADTWHWQCSQRIHGNRLEMAYWSAVHNNAANCTLWQQAEGGII